MRHHAFSRYTVFNISKPVVLYQYMAKSLIQELCRDLAISPASIDSDHSGVCAQTLGDRLCCFTSSAFLHSH